MAAQTLGLTATEFTTGQYLCTGYDLYLYDEPDYGTAMSILHSRFRRVVFRCGDGEKGALGGATKLADTIHSIEDTNHHFRVFRHVPTVAVVGGGITGAMAAQKLSGPCEVTVFDQGRRGGGGRASHRRVLGEEVVRDDGVGDGSTFEFDHGCQFTRADSARMKTIVEAWANKGWASPWVGPFGSIGDDCPEGDFFGLPNQKDAVFVGVGGMHNLVRAVLNDAKSLGASLRTGTRVGDVRQQPDGGWELFGVQGVAAFHDTSERYVQACASEASIYHCKRSEHLSLQAKRANEAGISQQAQPVLTLALFLSHAPSR